MPERFLLIQFSDRTWWKIPARIIADSRANYFAEADSAKGDGEYADVYKEEFEYTLGDDAELIDWAKNSMDWKDVKAFATQERSEDADYDKEWCNCDCEIITEGSK